MPVHLHKPLPSLPRPEFSGEAGDGADGTGGEGGNLAESVSGTLLAASLMISAIFVALATAALFY